MRFVAGRGAVAKHLVRGAAVAERHRENAGRGAVAKRLAALWRIAIRKMLAEAPLRSALREAAPWRSAIGKMQTSTGKQLRSEVPVRSAIGKTLMTGSCARKQHLEATPPRKAAGKGAAAGFDF